MIEVKGKLREELSHPFGSLCDIDEIISTGKKLVAVGDAVSLSTLRLGTTPFVSVFDGKTLRSPLPEADLHLLRSSHEQLLEANNPPSHFNPEILPLAKELMEKGGALYVEGEEDIAGLAFLYYATEEHIVYYGIRELGVVMVEGLQGKKIAEYFLKKMGVVS